MFLEYPDFLTEQECEDIAELVLDREEWVLKNIPTTVETTTYQGLTSKFYDFNWLPWIYDAGIDIGKRLFSVMPFAFHETLWIASWCNVLRQGEGLPMHNHESTVEFLAHKNNLTPKGDILEERYENGQLVQEISPEEQPLYVGHIFLSGRTETGTYYEEFKKVIPSSLGCLHVIDAKHDHKVVLNTYKEPRITMAMDIWHVDPTEHYEDDIETVMPKAYVVHQD